MGVLSQQTRECDASPTPYHSAKSSAAHLHDIKRKKGGEGGQQSKLLRIRGSHKPNKTTMYPPGSWGDQFLAMKFLK